MRANERVSMTQYKLDIKGALFCSHAKHAVAAVVATGLLREGYRCLDVFVQRLCLPLAHGIRRSEQLHGPRRHKGYEGILRRGSQRGYR